MPASASPSKQELHEYLSKYGQEHLIKFWDELNDNEKQEFHQEIMNTNFEEINKFYQQVKQSKNDIGKTIDAYMKPVPAEFKGSFVKSTQQQLNEYEYKGLEAVANNQVAVLLLAGGQGTRLGVAYPKGMYSVGLPSSKTLYQLQAERILRLQRVAAKRFDKESCVVPWYIMTSEHTQESTKEFFRDHGFFGLQPENVIFFEQFNLACLTHDGKVILDAKNKMSKAPDGNGGLYRALKYQKILDDFAKRSIKHVHVYCVDNILVKMADPSFVGFCITKNANCGAKVVKKAFPEEAVGVICKVNDRYQVVEYSEILPKTAQERDDHGDLKFNAGNICNHYFSTEFLDMVCNHNEHELKHHVAEKKIPYIDENGVKQTPAKPNGIKLEKFVFDVFQFSTAPWAKGNFAIWEVVREDEFSPLKNGDDAKKDTPTTCRNDLLSLHRRWLETAGATFTESTKENPVFCEISPLVSYAGENLSEHVNGKEINSTYILNFNETAKQVSLNKINLFERDTNNNK